MEEGGICVSLKKCQNSNFIESSNLSVLDANQHFVCHKPTKLEIGPTVPFLCSINVDAGKCVF